MRALVDPFSQVSIIPQSLCQCLRLKQRAVNVTVGGVGENASCDAKNSTSFVVKLRFDSNFSCEVEALVLNRISSYTPPQAVSGTYFQHIEGLFFSDRARIDVLLGASVHAQTIQSQIIKGTSNESIAMLSSLGWLLSGNANAQNATSDSVSTLHISENCQLGDILQNFWRMEELSPEQF